MLTTTMPSTDIEFITSPRWSKSCSNLQNSFYRSLLSQLNQVLEMSSHQWISAFKRRFSWAVHDLQPYGPESRSRAKKLRLVLHFSIVGINESDSYFNGWSTLANWLSSTGVTSFHNWWREFESRDQRSNRYCFFGHE